MDDPSQTRDFLLPASSTENQLPRRRQIRKTAVGSALQGWGYIPVFGHAGLGYIDENKGVTIYHAVDHCKVQRGLKIVLVARPMCETKFAK